MRPDLGAEAEDKPAAGEILEIPGCLGDLHRGAGEGDGYRGAELYPLCGVGGYGERQKRVVLRLAGPEAGEAQSVGRAGGAARAPQVPALAWYTATREELLWRGESVLSWIGNNALEVRIGGTYSLSDAAQAHRDLEGRKTTGKLLLIP